MEETIDLNKLYGNLVYSRNIDEVNYNDNFIEETESYIQTLKNFI